MSEIVRFYSLNYKLCFWVCLVTSVGLCVAGFVVPPAGVIDGSVLTAVGELFGFATLSQLPVLIHGRSVELTHGKTSLTLGDNDGCPGEREMEKTLKTYCDGREDKEDTAE